MRVGAILLREIAQMEKSLPQRWVENSVGHRQSWEAQDWEKEGQSYGFQGSTHGPVLNGLHHATRELHGFILIPASKEDFFHFQIWEQEGQRETRSQDWARGQD